jgi:kumamolisin
MPVSFISIGDLCMKKAVFRRTLACALCASVAAGAFGFAAEAAPLSSMVPMAASTQVLGAADASSVVHFEIALRMHDKAGLEALIGAHKVLTPAQLQHYLPDVASHQAVLNWLRNAGLSIEHVSSSRLAIRASGRADVVGKLLGVNFERVSANGRSYVAADREPALPAAIASAVVGVNGLQPQLHATKMLQFGQRYKAVPLTATGGKPPLYPADLMTAYKALGDGTGANTTTAIVIDTFPYTQDITQFWSVTGVTQSLSNLTLIQTVPGTLPAPSGEESLDVEQSSSIAPDSKVRVYASTDLTYVDIDSSFIAIIDDISAGTPITQVSISLGGCETSVSASQKTTDDNYFATMSALGASVFVSSGDGGAQECGFNGIHYGPVTPSFFSTSPNVTAVGGTSLLLSPKSAIYNERGWNFGGGGVSKYFATPSWQSSLGYAMRAVPDVSSDANPNTGVLLIYGGGQIIQVGGTSVSSPDWAGFMALTNSARLAKGKPTLGLVAARTTGLLGTESFRDITKGFNDPYSAGVGYDLVTGVGTPVMRNLQATLLAQP